MEVSRSSTLSCPSECQDRPLYNPVTCWEVRGGLQSLCPLEKGRIHISERDIPLPVIVEDTVSGKGSPAHAEVLSDNRASKESTPGNAGQVHTEGLYKRRVSSHSHTYSDVSAGLYHLPLLGRMWVRSVSTCWSNTLKGFVLSGRRPTCLVRPALILITGNTVKGQLAK